MLRGVNLHVERVSRRASTTQQLSNKFRARHSYLVFRRQFFHLHDALGKLFLANYHYNGKDSLNPKTDSHTRNLLVRRREHAHKVVIATTRGDGTNFVLGACQHKLVDKTRVIVQSAGKA
ncbi:hypothetical protein PsorP6_005771 [Peronosclerospora sorghi]|uniref:Uncharacterized protein n=1 Tax=Peronosclerospora sorghi TaxID=230839 RepID=A0ACC0W6R9_9STRA|nr:hypothetical protein PsorP6_005771 [Peronosclerospora sorghi]